MIKATVLKDPTDSGNVIYRGIMMKGRAEYTGEGKDIIYAVVSVLALNFFNSMEAFTEDELRDGAGQENMQFESRFTPEISPESELLMNSLILGLRNIEKDYRKSCINVKYKEV